MIIEEFKLYNVNRLDKWNKFTSMFRENTSSNVEILKETLPSHFLVEFEKDIEEGVDELNKKDKYLNYLEKYRSNQAIFDKLRPAKINLISYRVFKELENNETILKNLNTFKPCKGYASIAEYNKNSTISGRLTNVKNSPNILTLPSRCRKIFESRWQHEGELIYVDFKTLEPRVIRKINNKESSDDIYKEISSMLEFEVDRVIIKRGIISILYGSSSQIEGLSKERSDEVLNATKNYFDLDNILNLAERINEIGCRNNFFGRPIWNIEETQSNKLINNYIQSTAVDISLAYFSELSEKIELDMCKPIFIIHDALVLDVKKEYLKELENITSLGYNCSRLGNFPVETNKLSETY